MKKLARYFLSLFLVLIALVLPARVWAADFNVDCVDGSCTQTPPGAIFSESKVYPNWIETKTINLKNSSSASREMAIKAARTSPVGVLENVIQVSILRGVTVIWGGSLADFYAPSKVSMGFFAPGANADFNFTASMNTSAGNEYQGENTIFDLTLGFWEEVTPTPTSTPMPTSAPSGPVSAPVCGDAKPGSAPTLTSAVAGTNSVTLFWTAAAGPLSYYLAAYGTSPGVPLYGNPDIGGSGTTSYTVSSLSGGTIYYFKIRAGNGCMPGDYSNELSVTPGGGFIAGPAAGFIPGVLGAQEEEGQGGETPVPSEGEILGLEGKQWFLPSWLKILLGAGLGAGIVFVLLRRLFSR